MKYRIVEIPRVGKGPVFRIEAWGEMYEIRFFLPDKWVKCWVYVDIQGNPIRLSPGRPCTQEVLEPFTVLNTAKDYLEKIKAYKKQSSKAVFETEI